MKKLDHKFWFYSLIVLCLCLGIFFRFFNLDYKVYWHDEVYTTFRAAGYTGKEIDQAIFQNKILTPKDLQNFQQLKPNSTFKDTINSLSIEDTQHPPLYFLLSRFWMQVFGSSITVNRLLPALISLLSLPFMYALAITLFQSSFTALLATAILALSPVDILFAQTARQYSLLTLSVIASGWLLLKAFTEENLNRQYLWGYILTCVIGLYTHPFFGLILIAHLIFIIIKRYKLIEYLGSIIIIIFLYIPWLYLLINNQKAVSSGLSWVTKNLDFWIFIRLWILDFSSLLFDLDFGFDNLWNYLLRLPFLLLIVMAIFTVFQQASGVIRLFILTSIAVPFLILFIPDLLFGGIRSIVIRYLIPCFPGIQLAIAYFFGDKLFSIKSSIIQKRLGSIGLAIILTGSIISLLVRGVSPSWWTQYPSYNNPYVAKIINQFNSPLLISDIGYDFTNQGNLISLSYILEDDIDLLLFSYSSDFQGLNNLSLSQYDTIFVYRPSQKLQQQLIQKGYGLKKDFLNGELLQVHH